MTAEIRTPTKIIQRMCFERVCTLLSISGCACSTCDAVMLVGAGVGAGGAVTGFRVAGVGAGGGGGVIVGAGEVTGAGGTSGVVMVGAGGCATGTGGATGAAGA